MNAVRATDAKQISAFRDIRTQWRAELERGNFYAEGEQVVLRLLQSRLKIHSVLTTPEFFEKWSALFHTRSEGEGIIWLAAKNWIEAQTDQKLNQPCLAIAKIPDPPSLRDVLGKDVTFVALDGIDHAVNVGAILRNCAAFGVAGVVVDDTTVHPYSMRAVRSSLGGVFEIPVFTTVSLPHFLRDLRAMHRVALIAADPNGTNSMENATFQRSCCVIFGNEHSGLSRTVLDLEPQRVAIPISSKVDSLNVAAASAIFLHSIAAAKSFRQSQ